MKRFPEVRALCERARRPTTRLILGFTLLIPAGLMAGVRMAADDAPTSSASQAVVHPAAAEDGNAAGMAGAGTGAAGTAVTAAWREKTAERQREALTARLAAEFDVPLSLATEIHEAAVQEKIDPELGFKLVRAESSFRTRAVSPVGAVGLTQLLPSTARWIAPGTSRRELFEAETNLRVGFRYLRKLMDRFGDQELALTAYNRGPGTVNRLLKRGQDPDNGYADKVLNGNSARHTRLMNAKFGS